MFIRVSHSPWTRERLSSAAPAEGGPPRNPPPEPSSAAEYRPRRPEESVLYGVVAGYVETFLARQRERDRLVPRFVEREFRSFLDCGILARGFLRVHCDACRLDRLVPYSCKCRGFCPSCCGRRMADTAAHLVDRVFPEVPVRQWVLSVPFAVRYRLAYDSSLVRDVLQIWVRAVFASIRRRAGIPASDRRARCGAVTFIQRFSDALNLDPHFHTLALDGIYVEGGRGQLVFRHVPPPGDAEVARVADRVQRSVARLMERRGLGPQADPGEDTLRHDEPLLAELYGASVSGRIATGSRAGRRVAKVGDAIDVEDGALPSGRCCAAVAGYSVHAGVCVPARDRMRLERLARYAGRPPLASERLSALVPPPRFNLTRYSGVLAPASAFRPLIVPQEDARAPASHAGCQAEVAAAKSGPGEAKDKHGWPRNYPWTQLMARVFELDVLACPRCGAKMRILAAIDAPDAIRKILSCLGLPTRAPPVEQAQPHTDEAILW